MFAVLDLGLDLDVWPWVWLGTAIVFALVELIFIGGSFLLLPFAASAFIAAILAFYDVSVEIQWAVFVFGGGVLFAALYQWARKFMSENTMAPGVGADRLVGMAGIVTAPIYPDDVSRGGRVALAGESWGAIVEGVDPIPEGARVTVVSLIGTRVIVKPLSPTPPASAGREDP
ncbi:MAG TPA: NfeD family protein [Ilumatobacter sp.]|nr:NfeD family protein [Ilumatobacter sp.]